MLRMRSTLFCVLVIYLFGVENICCFSTSRYSWKPCDWERALTDLPFEVPQPVALNNFIGKLPKGLDGVLYKAGPAKFGRNQQSYSHWLEGDGAVLRLEFCEEHQEVKFSCRYVATETFQKEEKAGRILTRGTFGTSKQDGWNAFDTQLKNPANTNAVRVGNCVLAMSEVGLPYQMDPFTLETKGPETFAGKLRSGTAATTTIPFLDRILSFGNAISAHYCDVPLLADDQKETSSLVFAGLRQNALNGDTLVDLFEVDKKTGKILSETKQAVLSDTGFPPHDMACTIKHTIWITTPASGNLLPYILGLKGPAECLAFRKNAQSTLHLVQRSVKGLDERPVVKKFSLPRCIHPIHYGNSWEDEDGCITVIASCWDTPTIAEMTKSGESMLGSWSRVANGDFSDVPSQPLLKVTQPKETGAKIKQIASGEIGHIDYPKPHPDRAGRKCKYIFAITSAPSNDGKPTSVAPPQSFCKVDLESNSVSDIWYAGPRSFLDDFVLVPKESGVCSDFGDDEENVWLIAPRFHASNKTTSFVILDGKDLGKGPIFEARLDHHIPWGLHGSWHSS